MRACLLRALTHSSAVSKGGRRSLSFHWSEECCIFTPPIPIMVIRKVMSKQDLVRLVDDERDAHLAFLSSLIRVPSANPPGDTREAVKLVQSYLAHHNITCETIAPHAESPNLVSTLRGAVDSSASQDHRNLIFNGHIDAFPLSSDESWERDPYSGDIADGSVHGRGVVDMKAGTVASCIAYRYINQFRSQLSGQCTLEVVSDEETGGKYGTKYLIEQDDRRDVWKGDCVLNAEPTGVDSIRFGEKGTLRMSFEVRAQGGNGAYIHSSEGAIRIAARLIQRLVRLEDLHGEGMDPDLERYLQRSDVRKTADEIMGRGAADSMLKPTVNIGTIKGGAKVNMIPSYCLFEADIRLPIGLKKETVLDEIDKIIRDFPGTTYEIQTAASNPSAASSIDHELLQLLQKNAEIVRRKKPLAICSMGGTDCKHFRYNNIPAYSYGPSPATMAEKDEKVSVEEFIETIKVHTLAAWDYLGGAS